MAIGIRILSNNLSGQTTNVTYFPDTGGTIDLGTQVFPFNYISSYYYGDYDCYVPTYGYNYIVNVPAPTPTPSPTETQTNITPTPTNTPTETPTNTPTNTPTETITNTPSETPTNTPTETPTNTPTNTPTETPTNTPTNTPTETPTNTPSETPTETPTNTPSETPTNTPTETPTPTITPTQPLYIFNITSGSTPNIACDGGLSGVIYAENAAFDTNTQFYNNPNSTVSGDMSGFYSNNGLVVELNSLGMETGGFSSCLVVPSPTPTISVTPTQTPTISVTPTQTPTNTETPTNTPTNSETPTNTPTNSETPTQTPTNTETPTETPTNTPTPTQTETPTNTPSETPTNTPTNTITPSVTQSPVPSIITSGLIIQLDANSNLSYPGTGTTIYDLTGTYNHTINFTPFTILNGIKCFNNSTLNGEIQVNGTGPLLPNSGYTYITWAKIKPSSVDFRTLFKTNPNDHPIMVNIGTNDLGFYDNNTTSFVDSGYDVTPILDVWVQYSVVGDSSSSVFYINGVQVGTTAAGAGGNRHQYWGFAQTFGYLANCYLYDRKLTLSEITEQYNFLAPRFIEITPTPTVTPTNTPTPTL